MKRFDLLWVGRALDRIFVGAVASGLVLMTIWLGFSIYRADMQPFPTFGGDSQIDQIAHRLFLGFGCFWLIWAISFGLRGSRFDSPKPPSMLLLSLLPALLGATTWYLSLPTLNALLDVSPKIVTTINVQRTYSSSSRSETGSRYMHHWALVNRVDHPAEQVEIDWDEGCKDVVGIPSRIATIRLAPGAFGVPWFCLPVGCRPLAIDERPLFDDFYLGKGRAAVLVTFRTGDDANETAQVDDWYAEKKRDLLARLTTLAELRSRFPEADVDGALGDAIGVLSEDQQEELKRLLLRIPGPKEYEMPLAPRALRYVQAALLKIDGDRQLAHWTQAIEHRFPDAEIVVLTDSVPLDAQQRASCPRCRVASMRATDPEILALFRAGQDPWDEEDRVYLADGRGQMVFAAALRDIDQEPRLLDKLAVARAPRR